MPGRRYAAKERFYRPLPITVSNKFRFPYLIAELAATCLPPRRTIVQYVKAMDEPRTETDAELLSAVGRGDSHAFDAIYARHRQWVYRLAYRFTGTDADAWDVLQETFLYLARKSANLTLRASLRTLLFRVIQNLSTKANQRRRRLVAGEELLASLPDRAAASGSDDLLDVLKHLDLPHRQVVLLRYIDDLTIPEIADVLGIAEGTVKSRLFHAHQSIRDNPKMLRYFQP